MIEYKVPSYVILFDEYKQWHESTTGRPYECSNPYRREISLIRNEWYMIRVRIETEEDLIAFRLKFGV